MQRNTGPTPVIEDDINLEEVVIKLETNIHTALKASTTTQDKVEHRQAEQTGVMLHELIREDPVVADGGERHQLQRRR